MRKQSHERPAPETWSAELGEGEKPSRIWDDCEGSMDDTSSTQHLNTEGDQRQISLRWGIPYLDGGMTTVMNAMLEHYSALGLTNTEMMLIVQLASFKYESHKGECRPSVTETIRKRMGYKSKQGVLNVLKSVEDRGMLRVRRRKGKTSIYDLSPFAKAIERQQMRAAEEPDKGRQQNLTTDAVRRGGQVESTCAGQQDLTTAGQERFTQRITDKNRNTRTEDDDVGEKVQLLKDLGMNEPFLSKIAEAHDMEWIREAIEVVHSPGGVVHLHRENWQPARKSDRSKKGKASPNDRYRYIKGKYADYIEH